MQRALLALAILGPCVASGAADASHTDHVSVANKLLLFSKKKFTTDKCHNTVDEVHKNGKYTEESITPICEREMKWEKCDFFSEALSPSSSHPDFNKTQFCNNMDQAHFCSSSMDDLLSSLPVSDLAYGQCTRAKPQKSDAYCKKFQRMFAYAVQSEDLDTIRACYMIQAYSNMTASQKELEDEPQEKPKQEQKPVAPPPNTRIITSSGKEFQPAGEGKAHGGEHRTPEGVTKFGDSGIVVRPQPLEDFGGGKGHFVSPSRSTTAAPAPSPAKERASEEKKTIIVEPVPATEAGGQAFVSQASATVQRSPEAYVPRQVSTPSAAQASSAESVLGSVAASLFAGAFPASAVIAATSVPRGAPIAPANEVREVVVQIPASDAVQVNGQLQLTPAAVQKLLTLASHGKAAPAQTAQAQSMQTVLTKSISQPPSLAQGNISVPQATPVHLQAVQSSPARVVSSRLTAPLEASAHDPAHSKKISSYQGTHVVPKTSASIQTLPFHKPAAKEAASSHVIKTKAAVKQTAPVQQAVDQHTDRHLVAHAAKATALSVTAKTSGKLKNAKDNYKGFLSGFVDF